MLNKLMTIVTIPNKRNKHIAGTNMRVSVLTPSTLRLNPVNAGNLFSDPIKVVEIKIAFLLITFVHTVHHR